MQIKVEHLFKTYLIDGKRRHILNDASFVVENGEFVSIIGRSGSGKSTLLKIITALLNFDQGIIRWNDLDIKQLKAGDLIAYRQNEISFIDQDDNLISCLNVIDNITLSFAIAKKQYDKQFFKEVIDLMELNEYLSSPIEHLSGGQRQKVALARAILKKPSVIFADEPTANLDQQSGKEIMDLFVKINKLYKTTIIQVTHSLSQASYATKLMLVKNGNVVPINKEELNQDEIY